MIDPRPNTAQPPLGIRWFTWIARLALPRDFWREFGVEFETALTDRMRAAGDSRSFMARARLWLGETGGLAVALFRERRESASRRRTRNRQVNPPTPRRERGMFKSLKQDLLYALRMIVKTPVVTAIAVVSLAIGVAANTTVFSTVHSWLLRPLPYPDADRLVMVWHNDLLEEADERLVTAADYFDWIEQATSLEDWMAWTYTRANLTGIERPEQLTVANVTPNYFSVLAANPMLGRAFRPDEGGAEDTPIVLMSETLWATRFGSDPSTVGSTITLDGDRYTVVGVIPETFDFLLGNVNMWIATDFRDMRFDREAPSLIVNAWIREGQTHDQAQTEMSAIASRIAGLYPETNENIGVNLTPVSEQFPGPTDRGLIQILMAVVFLVLVIACVNVSSLVMAKTDSRHREIGVRVALGAGRSRLLYQLLTESVVLALIAGTLGTLLSIVGIKALVGAFPPEMPALYHPTFSPPVLGFSVAISILSGIAFGAVPAVHAIGGGLSSPLVEGSRGGTMSKRKQRLRSAFVVAEFALALTILMGAGVLTDLFHQRLDISPGFTSSGLVKADLRLPEYKYADDEAILSFVRDVEREIEAIQGTAGFTFTNVLPRARTIPTTGFTLDGVEYQPNEEPSSWWLSVTPDYFEVMDISLRTGRAFTAGDREDTAPVVLVSQRWADEFSDGNSPVGQRLTVRGESREIVGVVNNVAQSRLTGLLPQSPTIYFPMAQRPVRNLTVVMRTDGDPTLLVVPLQNAVWTVDRDQPIAGAQTVDSYIAASLAGPNVMTQILVIVGFLTLALAAIGIYGVMAYSVSQRTREIGIRMALGANSGQVLGRITKQGATLAGIGLLVGAPFAAAALIAMSRIVETAASQDGLSGADSVVAFGPMATIATVLVSVGLLASYLPARRATKVDPVTALGVE